MLNYSKPIPGTEKGDPGSFAKLMISELHMIPYVPAESADRPEAAGTAGGAAGTDSPESADREDLGKDAYSASSSSVSSDAMQKALTINEELLRAGFTLRPEDIARLAASPDLNGFGELIRGAVPSVNADPMYPDFPKQVMAMDEAVFRMHQLIHYFSTYGIEDITGLSVGRGWLPQVTKTEKTEEDERLLKASVLELVPEREAPGRVLRAVLSKRERLWHAETALVKNALRRTGPEALAGIHIPFKENLRIVFLAVLDSVSGEQRITLCRDLCRHTGDVLACIDSLLPQRGYHLKTNEKRMLVKLLESYPVPDLRANLILSRKKGARNSVVLQFLDYNVYSRSAAHKAAVAELRNGGLHSWEGQAKQLLLSGDEGALDFIAARPGMMLRMVRYLLSLGCPEEELTQLLCGRADRLSMYTVVSALNSLDDRLADPPAEEILERKLEAVDEALGIVPGKGFSRSPEDIHREYTWKREKQAEWLDRVDSRLRAQILSEIESDTQADEGRQGEQGSAPSAEGRRQKEQGSTQPEEGRRQKEQGSAPLTAARKQELLEGYREVKSDLEEQYRLSLKKLDAAEERTLRKEQYFARNLAAQRKKADREKRLLRKRFEGRVRSLEDVGTVQRILLAVLNRYFQEKKTCLAGRKVFVDLGDYAPEVSRIEAGQGSAEGGYVPSGIAYRIPDGARHVRLFVYWNDPERVDVDLHTAGYLSDGTFVHVGWSGDFHNGGMVHSGDITHSDAAEYIDIDLASDIGQVTAVIDLYAGKPSFGEIETCFAGLMAVHSLGEEVKLYNPANCFFSHELRSDAETLHYACVDVPNRLVYFTGRRLGKSPAQAEFSANRLPLTRKAPTLSLEKYLEILLAAGHSVRTNSPEEADVILTLGKPMEEKAVSLIDQRFFLK